MTDASPTSSWYEKQHTDRMCGAAALTMAFRYFGIESDQDAIWPEISRQTGGGRMSAPTYLLAQYARRRGLNAVVVHARNPRRLIERFADPALFAIVNQRLVIASPRRHFSAASKIEAEAIMLHDPYYGPDQRHSMDEFLELWSTHPENPAATGNILIALARRPEQEEEAVCAVCAQAIPRSVRCPRCNESIALAPAAALGCVASDCAERLWNVVFCPECDAPIGEATGGATIVDSPAKMEAEQMNADAFAKLKQYQTMLENACQSAEAGPARAHLQQLADQFSQQQALLADELKKAEERMQNALKETNEALAETRAKAEELKAKKAAMKAKPPKGKKAKASLQPIDAELGERLKSKLFEEFGFIPAAPVATEPDFRHEIEDWAEASRQDVQPKPTSPAVAKHPETESKPVPPDPSTHSHWDSWMESWGERQ